jgi:membrane associated rhomboid family serine protease
MFQNIPQVTKNILILNILFFVATLVMQGQNVDLIRLLGTHYVNSPLFEPFQIVTHFFMHANIFHIFINMWLFVMLGGFLERLWGPQRFFVFYIVSALAAFALHNFIGVYQVEQMKALLGEEIPVDQLNNIVRTTSLFNLENAINQFLMDHPVGDITLIENYIRMIYTPMVGASGAVFGVMAAFAILFPNTEFYLYFMIPVKAKYLVGVYLIYEVYSAFQNNLDDPVAHLAHIGGAVAGAILVIIWRKKDRSNFY